MTDRSTAARILWCLLGLFVLRVAGQAAVGLGYGSFLPAWEEWFSGVVAYPALLASQLVIVAVFLKICIDFTRGDGFFARPRRHLGAALLAIGSIYLGVMLVRYVLRMTLYPAERWTGGSIPIFFHWVLASFVLVMGFSHRRTAPAAGAPKHPLARRVALGLWWTTGAAAVLAWVAYQVAPTILASVLDARRPEYAVRVERSAGMQTRDGVTLRADIFHPLRVTKTPTILVRIPFSKTVTNVLFADVVGRFWAERGYTVVIQGTRGRYESGGEHEPLVHERKDGLETLHWLESQPWFDGRLGMWGGSTFGYTQWVIADALPRDAALMIQISSTSFYDMFYPGGAFSLSSALFWAMRSHGSEDVWPDRAALDRGVNGWPAADADLRAVGKRVPFFQDWIRNPEWEASGSALPTLNWASIDLTDRPDSRFLNAATFLMAGWFDPFLPSQLQDFKRIRARADKVAQDVRLVIGPWAHAVTVPLPGVPATRNYRLESLAPSIPWFDRHLRRDLEEPKTWAPVRLYVMGANVWRDEQEWPLARARETSWYLSSNGRANSASGDGRLTLAPPTTDVVDSFESDPQNPVPTRGGSALGLGAGVEDQSDVERRQDVLVYTSDPLDADTEVTGPVAVELFVDASTLSADFTAKLVDVDADGTPFNVCDGILRWSQPLPGRPLPELIPPVFGMQPKRIRIELWPTSMLFRRGHRIRLEIAGSNFPRFDRNPHDGGFAFNATRPKVSTQHVAHGAGMPSRLILPIVSN
jgi:putative CocE/NonD family hydrolase